MFDITDTQSRFDCGGVVMMGRHLICVFFFCSLHTEIGVGLAGFGIAFLFLGVLLLFDKGLLAIGNVRSDDHWCGFNL